MNKAEIIKLYEKQLKISYPKSKVMFGDKVKIKLKLIDIWHKGNKNELDIFHSGYNEAYLWSSSYDIMKERAGQIGEVINIAFTEDDTSDDKTGLYSATIRFKDKNEISFTQEHFVKVKK